MSNQELRTAVQLLSYMNGGKLLDELDAAYRRAVEEVSNACFNAGGVHEAKITLELKLKMDQKDQLMEAKADIKEKLPKIPLGRGATLWVTDKGTLSRENPKQRSMFDDNDIERQRRQNEGQAVGGHSV